MLPSGDGLGGSSGPGGGVSGWAAGVFGVVGDAAGDLATELSSFSRIRDRVDGLIRDLRESPAGPKQVSEEQVARGQFGGGANTWAEASDLFLSYGAVITELEKLSKLLSDFIEGMGIVVQASHKGYQNIDVDVRERMHAICAEATEQYGGGCDPDRASAGHGGPSVPGGAAGGDTSGGSGCPVVCGALGLLVLGVAAAPADADTIRSRQWHLTAMKAEGMWQTSTGKGVTVAVIDKGVDATNPDLRGQVLKGKDYSPDQPGDEHTDTEGHGTGMAGLIAGTGENGGGDGAFGLPPGVKILPFRVPAGATNMGSDTKQFIEFGPFAICYATDAGAKVFNISLGLSKGSAQLTDAVKYAIAKGVLIFAGVGNDADAGNTLLYLAGIPGVIGVGAVGEDLHKTDESQYGPQVDLAAPGENMAQACGGMTGLCTGHGTSAATALASASAALIWSAHPTWTNNQVLSVLLDTAGGPTSGSERNDHIGYGIVRPCIALRAVGDPGPAASIPSRTSPPPPSRRRQTARSRASTANRPPRTPRQPKPSSREHPGPHWLASGPPRRRGHRRRSPPPQAEQLTGTEKFTDDEALDGSAPWRGTSGKN